MATERLSDSYDKLEERVRRIANVQNAAGVLYWDQQVMMPEGGTPARSQQLSALSTVSHDLLTDDRIGELLDELEGGELDEEQAAVVREVRREYERAVSVPPELIEKHSRLSSDAQPVWRQAKAEGDFASFEPILSELVDLRVERARHIDSDANPYEVLFADGEPYLPLADVKSLFEELKDGLLPLIDAVRESDADLATDAFHVDVDDDTQMQLSRDVLETIGYDWNRGRLDTAPHPFMSGTQFDARVTTRFQADDLADALLATVHEFGHATYELGLRDDEYGTPLGESRSSGIHESQSRFWENHVGRTRAFWEVFLPKAKERVPALEDISVDDAYEAVNQVFEDNFIRVAADELTYHMHIILRHEIEQEIVAGDLAVNEIPTAWNDRMNEYLGIRPNSDSEGCLQDIHWTSRFASFENYTIGSVLAAQLHAAMERDLGSVDELVRNEEFDRIRSWLTENVHEHGQRYTTDELIVEATGEELTAEYFLEYVEEKYGELYELD